MSDTLMQRLQVDSRVDYIGPEGIVLADNRNGLRYCVVASYDRIAETFSFDVVPQPAWPAVGERDLRNVLAKVFEPRKVEEWITTARAQGRIFEDALASAKQLVERSYA